MFVDRGFTVGVVVVHRFNLVFFGLKAAVAAIVVVVAAAAVDL